MSLFLIIAFLFFIGSVCGWVLELFFRRFISPNNPERKWINPGFCTGPYLPIYGCGLCLLYLIASLGEQHIISNTYLNKCLLFIMMAVTMTVIEYIAGIISLKALNVRLWDYSDEWGNIQGIICPRFSLIWAVLGAFYYFFIHDYILNALTWLSNNLAFSFVIGLFFGVFIIDVVHSANIVAVLRKFAIENNIEVRFETIKLHIRMLHDEHKNKYNFFRPFGTDHYLRDTLKEVLERVEKLKRR